jgi:hypothetical protein
MFTGEHTMLTRVGMACAFYDMVCRIFSIPRTSHVQLRTWNVELSTWHVQPQEKGQHAMSRVEHAMFFEQHAMFKAHVHLDIACRKM